MYIHLLVTLGIFGFTAVMFLLLKFLLFTLKIILFLKVNRLQHRTHFMASRIVCCFSCCGIDWNGILAITEIITMVWFMLASISLCVKNKKNKDTCADLFNAL